MKILITGASSGIGFLTGCVLCERGHDVIMTTKTDKEAILLMEKLNKLKLNAKVLKLDITSQSDCSKIVSLNLDVLFLHAGVGYSGLLQNVKIDLIKENFEVNVFSNLRMMQLFLNNDINKPKKIVITSSLLANHAFPFFGSYIMTKTTIEIMIKILRRENYFTDNKFIIIRPGAYHTGFNQYMILSGEKNLLKPSIRLMLNKLFLLIESKSLKSIVYKIVLAIEHGEFPTYAAPFLQSLLMS